MAFEQCLTCWPPLSRVIKLIQAMKIDLLVYIESVLVDVLSIYSAT